MKSCEKIVSDHMSYEELSSVSVSADHVFDTFCVITTTAAAAAAAAASAAAAAAAAAAAQSNKWV